MPAYQLDGHATLVLGIGAKVAKMSEVRALLGGTGIGLTARLNPVSVHF